MNNAPAKPVTVAAVFDLRLEPSFQALYNLVGEANVLQYVQRDKPFLVVVIEPKVGETSRLAFGDEGGFLEFYRSTLRLNTTLEPKKRIQFVLRDVAPEFEETVRKATADLSKELGKAPLSA